MQVTFLNKLPLLTSMKYPDYKPKEIEPEILNFWKHQKILKQLKKRNASGPKFYFLEGPPYTSGRIHLGHAWNMGLKDMVLRYKRMNGCNVWDRMGYDMHGLPTEHKVMEKFGLKTKDDIIAFGIEKFSKECYTFSTEMAKQMNDDFIRLGSTLDFGDPYLPVTNEFIEAEWLLIKRAHEQNRLYLGKRTLHWCANCETALAKHECEYKTITDKSVFVKFPVKGKRNEFLIIWTTTPWTLPFNLAIMVNPKLAYVKVKVGKETWIVGEALLKSVEAVAKMPMDVIETMKGEKLDGLEYEHPWAKEIPGLKEAKKQSKRVHTVVLSEEYVTTDAGSGLVHCAPGCGPEDYEVGHFYHIEPFNNMDETGKFPVGMGRFSHLTAKKDDEVIIGILKDDHMLIATKAEQHEYPHCQRCHKPVIFRTTSQWFFKIEDLKEAMLAANESTQWVPDAGKRAFTSWLNNLRDNSISKQRFWGTPVPIWQCEKCEAVTVIGSLKELKQKAKKIPKNLHKPWIDDVAIKCACGSVQKRIPDILDVWIDAGTASWSCLYYPQETKHFDEWYPADVILEGKDQIRGWFNLLMVASFLAFNRPSFKTVYMHGFVTDVEGIKMSKSLGNIISPYEVIEKYSADVLRYYTAQTTAGEDINFSWDEIALKHRQLNVLWNVHKFLVSLTRENNINPFKFEHELMHDLFDTEERYIFSKLHHTIKKVTELFDSYHIDETIKPVEELFLELSRTYIQLVRDKSSVGSKEDKELVVYTIAHVLLDTLKLFAPIAPFVTEAIYQNMREEYHLKQDSIHLWEWPQYDDHYMNAELEQDMSIAQAIVQAGSHAREQLNLNVRWPMKEAIIATTDTNVEKAVEHLHGTIKTQLNIKELEVMPALSAVKEKVKADFAQLGPRYGEFAPQIIAKLATESPQTILSHINNDGAYSFTLDGTEVQITKGDLIIEYDVPYPYKAAEFKGGAIYLNQERTDELEAEGYARELMRRIQALRKKAGLEKTDRIVLHIKTSGEMKELLQRFEKDIQQKVGAEKIRLDVLDPTKKHHTTSVEKIKNQEFVVHFDKV